MTTTATKTLVRPVPKNPAATFLLMEIEPVLLTVDQTVQRPLDGVRVAQIAADFEPESLGVITVSERADGTHHIIDGQHRIAAMRVIGKDKTPVNCVLWRGLSRAEEAAMFRRLNNTRQVQVLDRFRVRIVEGDRVACQLNELLEAHGWTIRKAKAQGSFFAVSALEKVYNKPPGADIDTCDAVIRVATHAWGHESDGLRAEIVVGLGALLRKYPRLDTPKLVTELAKLEGGPLGLIGKAKQLRDIRGGLIPDAMAEILVNLHNKRRQTNRLPEWGNAA
jgi:hypothetical protein